MLAFFHTVDIRVFNIVSSPAFNVSMLLCRSAYIAMLLSPPVLLSLVTLLSQWDYSILFTVV